MSTVNNNFNVPVTVAGNFSSNLGIGATQFPLGISLPFALTNGAGAALKGNQILAVQGTIAPGASVDIDLYGGTDPLGNAMAQAVVKWFFIQNLGYTPAPTEADVLVIGGNPGAAQWTSFFGNNGSSGTLPGPAGASGLSFIMAGANGASAWAVGSGANNHTIRLTAKGPNGATYNLAGVGATS